MLQRNVAGARLMVVSLIVMRRHLLIAAVAACMLAAGCGSARAPSPVGLAIAQHVAPGLSEAGNKGLARTEATRLLSFVPVPANSVRLRAAPDSLSDPGMGTPRSASVVDISRSWRLPMSFAAAVRWLTAHRPARLRQSGSEQSSLLGRQTSAGYGYAGPANPAWDSADLDIEVGPDGHGGSVMRADGIVEWLDPVPYGDTQPGKRLRVLVAAGCPRADKGAVGVTNPGTDLRHSLLPPGPPAAGLTCRYYGMNGHPWKLSSQRHLDATRARQFALAMAGVRLGHAVGGISSCPADDGSAEVVALTYPGHPEVDLWLSLGGCRTVANGYIMASYYG